MGSARGAQGLPTALPLMGPELRAKLANGAAEDPSLRGEKSTGTQCAAREAWRRHCPSAGPRSSASLPASVKWASDPYSMVSDEDGAWPAEGPS